MTTQGTEPKVSGPTDVRVGDLIKVSRKDDASVSATTRVEYLSESWVDCDEWSFQRHRFDFEVLERPIDEDLLKGAAKAYSDAQGYSDGYDGAQFRPGVKAVIEFVRAYDKEHAQ